MVLKVIHHSIYQRNYSSEFLDCLLIPRLTKDTSNFCEYTTDLSENPTEVIPFCLRLFRFLNTLKFHLQRNFLFCPTRIYHQKLDISVFDSIYYSHTIYNCTSKIPLKNPTLLLQKVFDFL